MDGLISLDDIAKELRVTRRTIQTLASTGKLPAITVTRRGGFTYKVPLHSYFEWKQNFKKKIKEDEYLSDFKFLKEQQIKWLEWCRNGALTGKPMSEQTISKNDYYLNAYWKRLPRRYQRTALISVECLRQVLSSIEPKMFATKDNIYKAVSSFTKYLIKNNYCVSSLFDELKQLSPKRFYPPKKIHCTQEQFERLLAEANIRVSGQSNYDALLNVAIVATIGFTGLRASELCNLRMQDVDLVNRKIFVYLGKGKKNRVVGICNRLYEHLDKYLKARPETNIENFFVTISRFAGKLVAFNRGVLLSKLKRLSKRVGFDINLHGLRRTFATVAANSGKPINIISLALGHSDLKTTQGYLMTTQDEVIKEMQGW